MSELVFLDTETLGLDPAAPIWEFAAIRCRPGLPVEKREFFIQHDPGNWLNDMPASFADDYRNRYKPLAAYSEARATEEIHFITNGAVVIGCNPGFDIDRLTSLMRRAVPL
jgi:DNA polymerase III epsilon subunit-like protein